MTVAIDIEHDPTEVAAWTTEGARKNDSIMC